MTKRLQYMLELGVSDDADIEEIEDFLQQVLLDLYEQGQVEKIRVTKENGDTSNITDDDVRKVIDIIDGVDSDAVRKAIDSVKELEDDGQN